jgi:hypothetical protein
MEILRRRLLGLKDDAPATPPSVPAVVEVKAFSGAAPESEKPSYKTTSVLKHLLHRYTADAMAANKKEI